MSRRQPASGSNMHTHTIGHSNQCGGPGRWHANASYVLPFRQQICWLDKCWETEAVSRQEQANLVFSSLSWGLQPDFTHMLARKMNSPMGLCKGMASSLTWNGNRHALSPHPVSPYIYIYLKTLLFPLKRSVFASLQPKTAKEGSHWLAPVSPTGSPPWSSAQPCPKCLQDFKSKENEEQN